MNIGYGTSVYIGFKDIDGNPSAPLPIQQDATNLRGKKTHILNAGSFGTGKTEWLCQEMVCDAVEYPGNEILTGRRKLSWFESSTLPILLDAIPQELLLRHDRQRHDIHIQTSGKPSIIRYRQLDDSRDAQNQIKSMNLGGFMPDQVEEITENVFDAALGRLRRGKTPRQSLSTCNPAGRNWLWKRFIDKRGGKEYGYVEGRMWKKGVPAPVSQEEVTLDICDNPYLPWDYIASLCNDYPDNWLNRYVFCEWDNFEGLVYPMWRDDVHVCKPFEVPDWWNRIIAMDYGHRNPNAIGWAAVSGDGDVYLFDGYYKAGKWVDHHAQMLKIKSVQNGTEIEDVWAWPADPSIFHQQSEVTVAERYEDEGVRWERANNDVSGGIDRVAKYLQVDLRTNKPKFFIFDIPELQEFRDEIKEYCWENISVRGYAKNRPERPRKKNDHWMDMVRYLINHIEDSEEPVSSTHPLWQQQRESVHPKAWMGV